MSRFKAIRELIGASHAELSRALEMSSPNVSYMDRGQTVMPGTATKLIAYAATKGVALSYDHIYGDEPLPPPPVVAAASKVA